MGWASAASPPHPEVGRDVLVEQLAGEEWDGRASAASLPNENTTTTTTTPKSGVIVFEQLAEEE